MPRLTTTDRVIILDRLAKAVDDACIITIDLNDVGYGSEFWQLLYAASVLVKRDLDRERAAISQLPSSGEVTVP